VRSAQSALLYALDDPSPEVRAAALGSLGTVGDARALPALFTATDRGEHAALVAIGQLARGSDLKALLSRAPNGEVAGIAPALAGMMGRDKLPLETKLQLVRELEKLGTPSARTLLVQWLDAFKVKGSPALRKALFDALKRLDALEKEKEKHVVETTGGKS
jgi:HEAT repeat protein